MLLLIFLLLLFFQKCTLKVRTSVRSTLCCKDQPADNGIIGVDALLQTAIINKGPGNLAALWPDHNQRSSFSNRQLLNSSASQPTTNMLIYAALWKDSGNESESMQVGSLLLISVLQFIRLVFKRLQLWPSPRFTASCLPHLGTVCTS